MSRPTQDTPIDCNVYMYGTFTPCGVTFQKSSISLYSQISKSYYPSDAKTSQVWAIPRSIATTKGITIVFFSSGY